MENRYVGKPFLRLLECYVLDAIGHLDPHQAEALKMMEPKLGETYGMQSTWQAIVATQMALPASLPSKIRSLWDSQRKARGSTAPQQFAVAFVDQNFPDAVGMFGG